MARALLLSRRLGQSATNERNDVHTARLVRVFVGSTHQARLKYKRRCAHATHTMRRRHATCRRRSTRTWGEGGSRKHGGCQPCKGKIENKVTDLNRAVRSNTRNRDACEWCRADALQLVPTLLACAPPSARAPPQPRSLSPAPLMKQVEQQFPLPVPELQQTLLEVPVLIRLPSFHVLLWV